MAGSTLLILFNSASGGGGGGGGTSKAAPFGDGKVVYGSTIIVGAGCGFYLVA